MKRNLYILLSLLIFPILSFPGNSPSEDDLLRASFSSVEGTWARQTLARMTLDEKIGQLFMVAAFSNKDETHVKTIKYLVEKIGIGGLIFMQGTPDAQIKLVNQYQKAAKYPLLVSQDSEWGLNMRLDNTVKFPRNLTLGAIQDDSLIYEVGLEIGKQCRRVGVHMNFAPVIDVNNNPGNPVINDRSFGEVRENVAIKGIAFNQGLFDAGVLGCAKHFPGHGDTDVDSHKDLPIINHTRQRLDSIEMYPFRELIAAGIPSIMTAHLDIPTLDDTPNLPSTLSHKVVNNLLREELGFQGLIITDAMNMKGVTKYYEDGEADVKALLAGNDILLFSPKVIKTIALIKQELAKGTITENEIDDRVFKILLAKEWAGLHENRLVPETPTDKELNSFHAKSLKRNLYASAVTVVQNKHNILPLKNFAFRKIAHVKLGGLEKSSSSKIMGRYASIDNFYLPAIAEKKNSEALLKKLANYNTILITVDGMNKHLKKKFGITSSTMDFIKGVRVLEKSMVVTLLGSPYALRYFGEEEAIVVAYENDEDAQLAAAEAIFGGIGASGKLPISSPNGFPAGTGVELTSTGKFTYAYPEEVGMDPMILSRIDSIANAAVSNGATPGCQVIVLRNDKVVHAKSYGKTQYKKGTKVEVDETLYDIASVTKIGATTISTMRLIDEGKIKLNESIAAYLPEFRSTDKANIQIKNLLMHNAGLRSWIPFYTETFDSSNSKQLAPYIYQDSSDQRFCVPILGELYMCVEYQDSIWLKIKDSKVRTDGRVIYSDLSMIIMGKIIEKVTGTTLDNYADSVFYKPMGMSNTIFNPWKKGLTERCAPTEEDDYWRNAKIQGYVHDQASAMFGGVSGHAGLFSNVWDLAKLLQMLKNGGSFGGEQFIQPQTIEKFTAKQLSKSRKGLGFDKAEMDSTRLSPCSKYSSELTFGHTGFTGIGAWVDPKEDLIYVFLSNRTYPTSNNKKLIRQGVRTDIMDAIYESIYAYSKSMAQVEAVDKNQE